MTDLTHVLCDMMSTEDGTCRLRLFLNRHELVMNECGIPTITPEQEDELLSVHEDVVRDIEWVMVKKKAPKKKYMK